MKIKKTVEVIFTVEVEIDETKFTPEFLAAYERYFYELETLEEHICHLAQLEVRDMLFDFTEGYGEIAEMGIKAKIVDQQEEII